MKIVFYLILSERLFSLYRLGEYFFDTQNTVFHLPDYTPPFPIGTGARKQGSAFIKYICITKSLCTVHSDNTRSFLFVIQLSRCISIEFAIVFNTMSFYYYYYLCWAVFRFSVQQFDELIPAMNRQRNCVCLYCLLTVLGRTSPTVVMDLLMQLVVN